MSTSYYVVTEHPGAGGQRTDYTTDRYPYPSYGAADRAGRDKLGHDGFWVATVEDGRLTGYEDVDYDRPALVKALGISDREPPCCLGLTMHGITRSGDRWVPTCPNSGPAPRSYVSRSAAREAIATHIGLTTRGDAS